jgi:hypothetical protein
MKRLAIKMKKASLRLCEINSAQITFNLQKKDLKESGW